MTIANMSAEMGAKSGFVDPTGLKLPYEFIPTYPDSNAKYIERYHFDVSTLQPQVAAPHYPDRVVAVGEVAGQHVDQAFIGSCTNARLEDLQMAARVLKGKKIHSRVRLIIAPASKRVLNEALRDGTAAILSEAGATFITSGCGPCVGTHQGVPGDGEVIISSTNRNFRGRMGNRHAEIYLGSPAVVAASALEGEISDPVKILAGEVLEWELS
jgi:3-isopropylmalate/(R)-2-methylmalate dehydratase large subunit